jgi:hypothetical protein
MDFPPGSLLERCTHVSLLRDFDSNSYTCQENPNVCASTSVTCNPRNLCETAACSVSQGGCIYTNKTCPSSDNCNTYQRSISVRDGRPREYRANTDENRKKLNVCRVLPCVCLSRPARVSEENCEVRFSFCRFSFLSSRCLSLPRCAVPLIASWWRTDVDMQLETCGRSVVGRLCVEEVLREKTVGEDLGGLVARRTRTLSATSCGWTQWTGAPSRDRSTTCGAIVARPCAMRKCLTAQHAGMRYRKLWLSCDSNREVKIVLLFVHFRV